MRHILALTAAAALGLAGGARAQGTQAARFPVAAPSGPADSVITSMFYRDQGLMVEVAGLKRWTPEMISDSLSSKTGGAFWRQVCSDKAQRDLGIFPQSVAAQVVGDSGLFVFAAIIEPQDSALVTVRKLGNDTKKSVAPWPELVDLARRRTTIIERAMIDRIHGRGAGLRVELPVNSRADGAEILKLWATLDARSAPADVEAANKVLLTSPNMYDRLAAVAILSSFIDQDAAWHALVGALLDPKPLVREFARATLRAFGQNVSHPVDWAPATKELHALMQGSDLFFFNEALDLLVTTGIDPKLASPILRGGGHAVLMFAGAQSPWARGPAFRFLHQISGQDLGGQPGKWREWIASL